MSNDVQNTMEALEDKCSLLVFTRFPEKQICQPPQSQCFARTCQEKTRQSKPQNKVKTRENDVLKTCLSRFCCVFFSTCPHRSPSLTVYRRGSGDAPCRLGGSGANGSGSGCGVSVCPGNRVVRGSTGWLGGSMLLNPPAVGELQVALQCCSSCWEADDQTGPCRKTDSGPLPL